ncbi:Panacea domain-containing protein [Winogradskyella thalassocola]|uniref:Uncharacterized phage-associated protein n=1 Tax=Winogradskyella thalassocola TaxID=262004 RepID=A0A1G8FFS9_9FLAO|nr:type II toxin-antitoxin system antitoxin SocA domain-containing protein [Winogradskyella thalassocola]SDH81007.1 Uncharacterized phage-associated protein [Winogradskyella thalassocola]
MSISPLKLQKLLYYVQVWNIIKFDKYTLFDELPEAWVNGPVYRSVYNTFKDKFFRNDNFKYNFDEVKLSEEISQKLKELSLSEDQQKLLFAVLDSYGVMSDEKLVFLTHKESPWNEAREGLSPIERSTNTITVDSIYNYYTARLKKKNA